MKRNWFNTTFWVTLAAIVLVGFFSTSTRTFVLAQESTPTLSDVFITVTYTEQINVRNGPSTALYDIIGNMQPGETAKALGVSPGRDWVQIEFPAGPNGKAWVYASFVSFSSDTLLQIVEPPPTITPRVTATIDPTLAAAFEYKPTATRLPTFTPPAPLEVPSYTEIPAEDTNDTIPMGVIVLGLGILGSLGYFVSLLRWR